MNQQFLNLLGLSRKAGKLSHGHDASFGSISKRKAKACFLTQDASERLKQEFQRSCTYHGRNIPCEVMDITMNDLNAAIGVHSAVITINDAGFASRLLQLLKEDNA